MTEMERLRASDSTVERLRHDVSCRDPLIACMALVFAAERAHVAGCRTPPLTPVMMHLVNTAASEGEVLLTTTNGVVSPHPNWWRNVGFKLNDFASSEEALVPIVSRCWRHATVREVRTQDGVPLMLGSFLRLASLHARALTSLSLHVSSELWDATPLQPLQLSPLPHLTSLAMHDAPIALETVVSSAPRLERLTLHASDCSNFRCLTSLRKLRVLSLVLLNIGGDDLAELDDCRALEELSIRACHWIRDVPCPSLRKRLRVLNINSIGFEWNVSDFPALDKIVVTNPDVTELSQLERQKALSQELSFSYLIDPSKLLPLFVTKLCLTLSMGGFGRSTDVTPLATLPWLRELEVDIRPQNYTQRFVIVGSLRGSAAGAHLARVCVSHVAATAFSDGLFAVPALTDLKVTDSPELTAASHLEWCPALESLTLEDCGVTAEGLAGLRQARRLRRLSVSRSASMPDLTSLDFCASLEFVQCRKTGSNGETEEQRLVPTPLTWYLDAPTVVAVSPCDS